MTFEEKIFALGIHNDGGGNYPYHLVGGAKGCYLSMVELKPILAVPLEDVPKELAMCVHKDNTVLFSWEDGAGFSVLQANSPYHVEACAILMRRLEVGI